MNKLEVRLLIAAIVAVLVVLVANFAFAMTTVEEGAEALAEYACAEDGGAQWYDWYGEGPTYTVVGECEEGGMFEADFNCPLCEI